MKKAIKFLFCIVIIFYCFDSVAVENSCYAYLKNDTLTIGNTKIEREFLWNDGNLITNSLTDKTDNHTWISSGKKPDLYISDNKDNVIDGRFLFRHVEKSAIQPERWEAEISYKSGSLHVKRIYRLYENCPVIACDTYLKGTTTEAWAGSQENPADLKNIESDRDMVTKVLTPVIDQLYLSGKHWKIDAIEFFDVTDRNNTLVKAISSLSYHKNQHKGNLLFAHNTEIEKGIFFLKEAPCSSVQLAYPGSDFISEFGNFMVTGIGITSSDLKENEWTKTYSCILGVYEGSELNRLTALRNYQKQIRTLLPGRDEMVMMNTWGDRSQDKKVNETFCLKELEKAALLGISHFQIDDGWQYGKSANSAFGGSFKNIWDNPDYWKPDPEKYPKGLKPIVEKGKELNIEICLWFNPSIQNNYKDWEKDAEVMINLYKRYGVRTFKIDGLMIPNKLSEMRVRQIFTKVLEATDYQAVFNLDATAGRRTGYFFFNEFGNIFLENRYTDWTNYYPYWTTRNLWMLSKYVPAEKIQVEFLNKWRNSNKYNNDPFAPSQYTFDYLFAITMPAQPLAWMEATGLPEVAFSTGNLIKNYRDIQHDFHKGIILPIGDEPSGKSWTGFQSISGNEGYLIIFREKNPEQKSEITTWLPEGKQVVLKALFGKGTDFTTITGKEGKLNTTIPEMNDFVIYKYQIKEE